MNKLKLCLENCYGINKMECELDFSKRNIITIYSPNGTMKTSFANTFKDICDGKESIDRIKRDRITKRVIEIDTKQINKDEIFVVEPFNQGYRSEKVSTLLVNKKLRDEYDNIHKIIDEKKGLLLNAMETGSGIKNNADEILSDDILHDKKEFYTALLRLEGEVKDDKYSYLSDIVYVKIFNDKVQALLNSQDFKTNINEYMKAYDALITKSTFFKKGVFNCFRVKFLAACRASA